MAQLYTVTYTRTNMSNTAMAYNGNAGNRVCYLSSFQASGNGVGKKVKQVVSVTFNHYHTRTKANQVKIRSVLVSTAGEVASSYVNVASSKDTVNTFSGVSADVINTLTGIRLEWQKFDSNTDLYYRATSEHPQVLTITFYAVEGVHCYVNSEWKDAEAYVYSNGIWVQATPYYYLNGEFIQTE